MFVVENVIQSVLRKNSESSLNILLIGAGNEKYTSLLCKTPHNFFLWDSPWNDSIEERPENLSVINQAWPSRYFDMVICNDRFDEYNHAASLATKFHFPIILIDHCSSNVLARTDAFGEVSVDSPQSLHKNPHAIISRSQYVNESWPHGKLRLVIPAAIDPENFCIPPGRIVDPDIGEDLTDRRIVFDNSVSPQVGQVIFGAMGGKPYTVIPTDSPMKDKKRIYQQGDYFINPKNHVTIKMLEAMLCGNIPVCFNRHDIQNFIENEKDGFIIDDLNDISSVISHLDSLPEEKRQEIANNAREKVISTHLSTEEFVSKWESVFNYMKSQYYAAEV